MKNDDFSLKIQEKYRENSFLIEKIERILEDKPYQKIWCRQQGKNFQYYIIKSGNKISRKYIRKKDLGIVTTEVQKEYYFRLLPLLKKHQKLFSTFLLQFNEEKLIDVYRKLPLAKRILIQPLFIDNETFAAQWQAKNYERKKEQPERNLVTAKGESVRSKSEVIIANMLNAKGVPYHYEFPVTVRSGLVLYPDFFCLNKRTRQEVYWEHCGMMDDPEYTSGLVKRLSLYSQKNIIPGKNLILTMETSELPLNTKEVEKMIAAFLL